MVNVEYKVNTPLIVKPLFNNLWCRCDLSGRNGDEPFNILCIITHNISIKGKKTIRSRLITLLVSELSLVTIKLYSSPNTSLVSPVIYD